MLQEPLTEKEINFMQAWHDPTAMTECLIPVNMKAPHLWKNEDCELVRIRNYQFAMQNYSHMYADNDTLSRKQNFQNRKKAGDLINIAARNIGKSFLLIIDAFIELMHGNGDESCIASFDHKHLMKVCKPLSLLANFHPFFQIFKRQGKSGVRFTGGGMEVDTMKGHTMYGKNEKVKEPDPGTDFHGLHYRWFGYEEFSYASKKGTEKRVDSGNSEGYIEKISGIPDIRIDSPLGQILAEPKNKNIICRLPQFCVGEGSKISMADFTTKNIEDVNVGDEIFSVTENKPHRLRSGYVTNKVYNGIKETVLLSNGINDLFLTSDHKLLTKMSKFYRSWKSWDELDKNRHQIYYFKNYINILEDYYKGVFLGFLETEGSFKQHGREKSIGQKIEKEALRWLLNHLDLKYTECKDKKDSNFSYFYLSVDNNIFIDSIYSDLEENKDVQIGFIAGCIYGDGCVHFNKKTNHRDITIVQKNKVKIIEKILNLAEIKYSRQKRICDTNFGHFEGFQYILHRYEIPLCLPFSKKSEIYRKLTKNNSLMSIQHRKVFVKKKENKKVYDLTTTCGTFVANGFLVHNCREDWGSDTKQEMIDKYNGESSYGYKLNVKGDIIEGAQGFWDMERLRKACRYGKTGTTVKFFEIDKKKYQKLDQILILDRLPCKQCYVASDIGTTGSPSEIIIVFFDGEKYNYHYNIALYKLTTHEQAKVFAWIYERLGGAYISLDSTNADGRSIADDLRRDTTIPADEIIEVRMNKNLEVDFLKDEVTGKVMKDSNGKPLMREERTIDWAMTRLEKLFFQDEAMRIPTQEKFISTFSDFIVKQVGMKRTYGTLTGNDHLHQSFQCFAIAQFLNEFRQQVAKPRPKRCYGTFSNEE